MKSHSRRFASIATFAFYSLWASLLGSMAAFGAVAPEFWAVVDLALFSATAVTLVRCVRDSRRIWHWTLLPILAYGGVVGLQISARTSISVALTKSAFPNLVGCFCALLLAEQALRRTSWRARWAHWCWFLSGVLSVEAIAQYYTAHGYIYWLRDARYGTPFGPFVYHNAFAACMEAILPLAFCDAIRQQSLGKTIVCYLPPVLGVISVVLSGSRGGILVTIVELVFFFGLIIRRSAWNSRKLVAAGGLLFLFAGLALNWRATAVRFEKTRTDRSIYRLYAAESSWAIFRNFPIVGSGFDTFQAIYPAYQLFDTNSTWVDAHDDWVQNLAETGIVGTACAILVLLILIARTRQAVSPDRGDLLAYAAGIGALGLTVHAIGDFVFHIPAAALLFFSLLGFCLADVERHAATEKPHRTLMRARKRVTVSG